MLTMTPTSKINSDDDGRDDNNIVNERTASDGQRDSKISPQKQTICVVHATKIIGV